MALKAAQQACGFALFFGLLAFVTLGTLSPSGWFGSMIDRVLLSFGLDTHWNAVTVWSDKQQHMAAYAGLCLLGTLTLRSFVFVPLGLFAFGGSLELLQAAMQWGRQGDPLDLAANTLGIGVGALAAGAVVLLLRTMWPMGLPVLRAGGAKGRFSRATPTADRVT
jgi:hypothetical protein